jgi:hypothetical protein
MTTQVSPTLGRHYLLATVCEVLQTPRSTVYAQQASPVVPKAKRGPKTVVCDEALLAAITEVLAENAFPGEGYKKVRIRLRHGRWRIKAGKHRILRLKNLAHAQAVIAEFVARYNRECIVARLGYRSPSQARAEYHAAQSSRSA